MKNKLLTSTLSLLFLLLTSFFTSCGIALLSEPPAAVKVEFAKNPSVSALTYQSAIIAFDLTF